MKRHLCLVSSVILAGVFAGATAIVAQPSTAPPKPPAKPAANSDWSAILAPFTGQKAAPPLTPPPPTREKPANKAADTTEAISDPTQPQQPLLDVYALTKGAKNAELPSFQLKGRVTSDLGAAALLGVDGQPSLILVREGVTLALSGAKHAGIQVRVTKIDELGVHLAISRLGQTQTEGLPVVLY